MGTMKPISTLLRSALLVLGLGGLGCSSSGDCVGDNCVCPATGSCEHACTPGAPSCHIQGQPGSAVDVQCADNAECHVECSQAASCRVDCGGSTSCEVTCPPTGCTVTSCVGDCDVSCGFSGRATQAGTTATCP